MENYYEEARKLGQKCLKQSLSRGEYPYLPVLDELLSHKGSYKSTDAGLKEIPAEFIIGTKTSGRTRSFARNFMPVLEPKSEFAIKWNSLCKSHLEEGIRDPVILWEYMNRFYVQEGNKRVSVLKYFGAPMIPARVNRILPERTKEPDVERYYAFLSFCEISGTNFVEFSRASSYKELCSLLGKPDGHVWTEEESRDFSSAFFRFKQIFLSCHGDRLRMTTADALLVYLRIYGYDNINKLSADELKKSLMKIWEEILLDLEDSPVEIRPDPDSIPKKSSKLTEAVTAPVTLLKKKKLQKIAFLYSMDPKASNWLASHESGRAGLEAALGDRIETRAYVVENGKSPEDMLRLIIKDGAKVIFVPQASLISACVRVAVEHPEVEILNCSLNKPHRYIRSYYPRMYEAKFVTGAIAGAIADNGRIGFICKYPVYGMTAEINAFARGAALTAPLTKVYLEWSSLGGISEAESRLKEKDVHLISYRDFYDLKSDRKAVLGLIDTASSPENDEEALAPLVLPVWNWGNFYEKITESILAGAYQKESKKTRSSLNYFWGMSAGVVDIIFSGRLPQGVRYLGDILCDSIRKGIANPFFDPDTGEGQSMESIITMDRLEKNIIGSIPTYDELDREAQLLVNEMGVASAREDHPEL